MSVVGPLKTSCPLILTKLKKLFFTVLLPETFAFRLLCQELKELNLLACYISSYCACFMFVFYISQVFHFYSSP